MRKSKYTSAICGRKTDYMHLNDGLKYSMDDDRRAMLVAAYRNILALLPTFKRTLRKLCHAMKDGEDYYESSIRELIQWVSMYLFFLVMYSDFEYFRWRMEQMLQGRPTRARLKTASPR